jgi:hypothetical protein
MTQTTRLKELLERKAANNLFDKDGEFYAGGLDSLFPAIAEAAIGDGISAKTVMKMLVSTAFEILRDPGAIPGEGREIGALVVQEAQRLYSGHYPTAAEVEELRREAAAWRAAHPRKTTQRQGRAENCVKSTTTH